MRLLIISHTPHFTKKMVPAGWGPTVREIDHLAEHFDVIYHASPLHRGAGSDSYLPYSKKNIIHIPLKPSGGNNLLSKLKILLHAPANLLSINKVYKKVDVFQLRLPTGMGVYLLPLVSLFYRKFFWIKYAGNWQQANPPLGYRFQKQWLNLNLQRSLVTINGTWEGQKKHLLSFENPCLSETERVAGLEIIENKVYTGPFNFCFVGRVEKPKGIERIYESMKTLAENNFIKKIIIVGEGSERDKFMIRTKDDPRWDFIGGISRDKVAEILASSHFLLLPSTASEGFPKVIAEACNFGCIPIVSSVSSISQYIKNKMNGFVLEKCNSNTLTSVIIEAMQFNEEQLREMAYNGYELAGKFTFQHYENRILNEILN